MAMFKEISILIEEMDNAIKAEDTDKANDRWQALMKHAKGDDNLVYGWIWAYHNQDA